MLLKLMLRLKFLLLSNINSVNHKNLSEKKFRAGFLISGSDCKNKDFYVVFMCGYFFVNVSKSLWSLVVNFSHA